MQNKELAPSEKKEVTGHEPTFAGRTFVPEVDIFEDNDALWLWADMPGVKSDGVTVELHEDVLSLQGKVATKDYSGLSPVYTEYNVGHYARSFTLSNKIDQEQISAQLEDGVLMLTLPKAKEAQPRRISVG